ncbi:MAG: lipoyl(octanoyl) transferase LipB [Hyphomicrobiales bacterium]|nr:lipoyl(octanoyl) transferase LipB [Hyphomicrobiales bacterium]
MTTDAVTWRVSPGLTPYASAVSEMEERAAAIHAGTAGELIWLVEHRPLYTAGTSADDGDILAPLPFPLHRTGRGGRIAYHGPGQRIAYVMLDLNRRGRDVRAFVTTLQDAVIGALAEFGVRGEVRDGRPGVWVATGGREDKIAAIGVRVRRWVTFHGVSVNIAPDLTHYAPIVPCGLREHGVTSLRALGVNVAMPEFDSALRRAFEGRFGATGNAGPA